MKKLLTAACAVLLALTAAVAEKPKMAVDANFTVPVMSKMESYNMVSGTLESLDRDVTTAVGADVSFRAMFTDMLGVYAQAGIYFPIKEEIEEGSFELTIDDDLYENWVGFNFLVAPAITPINNEKFVLTIAPGLAVSTQSATIKSIDIKINDTFLGLGANVGFDINLTEKIYIKPALEMDYYFYEWFSADDFDEDDGVSVFTCKPSIGVGIRF